jgi:hypothetical protein
MARLSIYFVHRTIWQDWGMQHGIARAYPKLHIVAKEIIISSFSSPIKRSHMMETAEIPMEE